MDKIHAVLVPAEKAAVLQRLGRYPAPVLEWFDEVIGPAMLAYGDQAALDAMTTEEILDFARPLVTPAVWPYVARRLA